MPTMPFERKAAKRFLAALADGLPVTEAARFGRRHRSRFYRWRARDREFAHLWSAARWGQASVKPGVNRSNS